MINVLFVCLGNICRSPLAEGIFDKKLEERNLSQQISCDSAGTGAWHIGKQPDPRSIEIARKNEIILNHQGRQLSREDFTEFDYIIAMDRDNYRDIEELMDGSGFDDQNLIMMRQFDDLGKGENVPDPYFGGSDGFKLVFEMLDRSCDNLIDHIISKNNL